MAEKVTEMKETGFFGKNEGILLISSNYNEKQQIEDGLNRDITRIDTTMDLVETISALETSEGMNASVIITKETPSDIKKNIEDVVNLLTVIEANFDVPIFEVGIGSIVTNAFRYNSVNDFITYARNQKRKTRIGDVKDVEQRSILEELQMETESKTLTIKELNESIEESDKEKKRIFDEKETFQKEVDLIELERDDAVERVETMEENIDDLERRYETEKLKNKQYQEEKDEALNELTDLRVQETSYKKSYSDKVNEIRKLKRTIENNNKKIDAVVKEKEDLFKTRVDSEDHVILNDQLEKERKEVEKLQASITKLYVENQQKEFEYESLQDEINFLRDGEENIETMGRTLNIDSHEFANAEIIYIKVFEELPYFRLATKMFFEKVSKKFSKRTHMVILKHDDGIDSEIFNDIPLWSKLKDVPSEDEIVRIFPNPYIFSGVDKWEEDVGLIVVVDYIKNNTYYAKTKAREKIMTVVRRYDDIEKYGLEGSPITLDGRTVFDIQHDPQIQGTKITENRHRMLSHKVDGWVDKIYG